MMSNYTNTKDTLLGYVVALLNIYYSTVKADCYSFVSKVTVAHFLPLLMICDNVWLSSCTVKVILCLRKRLKLITVSHISPGDVLSPINSARCHVQLEHGCTATAGYAGVLPLGNQIL